MASEQDTSPVPGKRLRPGAQVGRYVLTQELGQGGMGIVWSAIDPQLNRLVAIKLLHRRKRRTRARARLLREAQAMARLDHPNVVSVFDVGTVGDRVFVAMEHLDGGTLASWLQHPREWSEVVALFRQAGAGLAAAHAAGLIHRDFKPENVLLTPAGVAKVTDFGLVRATRTESSSLGSESGEFDDTEDLRGSVEASDSGVLETPLTRVGAQVGTPAYMAPEQFLTGQADERSDQFSFCVALHEGLWGARPFAGLTVDALRDAVVDNRRLPRRRDSRVPSWLEVIVERGLAPKPEQRFESMNALLAALADDPSQRRRRGGIVLCAAALVGLVAAGLWTHEEREQARCASEAASAEELWSAAVSAEVAEAMDQTGAGYAGEIHARVSAALDDWTGRWSRARAAACEAARSEEPDPRAGEGTAGGDVPTTATSAHATIACLEGQLVELSSFIEVLHETDRASLARADAASARLSDPAQCSDPIWLEQTRSARTANSEQERRALRELARARALFDAGRYREIGPLLGDQLLDGEGVSQSTRLEAALLSGHAAQALARYVEARESLERARFGAVASGLERLNLEASVELAELEGLLGNEEPSARWIRESESLIAYLGDRPEDRIVLHELRGKQHRNLREYDEANNELSLALELSKQLRSPGHPEIAELSMSLGHLSTVSGDFERARELLDEARALWVERVGEEHPEVAKVDLRIAEVDRYRGELDPAIARLERVLERQTKTLGREHLDVASALDVLAIAHAMKGDMARSLELMSEGLAIAERLLDPSHPTIAAKLSNLANVYRSLSRLDEARAVLERAVTIYDEIHGPDSIKSASLLYTLGTIEMQEGELEAAIEHMRTALRVRVAADGEHNPHVLVLLGGLGGALCEAERFEEGAATLRRSLRIMRGLLDPGHPDLSVVANSIVGCERSGELGEPGEQRELLAKILADSKLEAGASARAEVLVQLGELALDLDELAGAHTYAKDAAANFDALQEPRVRARVRWLLTRTHFALDEREAAEQVSREALDELREHVDPTRTGGTIRELADTIESWRRTQGWPV